MKVCVVCDVLGEPNNGTTIATLNLIRFLIKQGHEVKVVSNDFEKAGLPEEVQCKLPTLNLGHLANKIIEDNGVSLAFADTKVLEEAMSWADVVHVQMPLLIGMTAAKIARKLDKPLTASFHCQAENVSAHVGLQNNTHVSKLIYKSFYHSLYRYCDCVHYPTLFIKKLFEKSCGHKTCAYVISNGVNSIYVNKNQERKNDKFTIVSTGRFSTEKAQELTIKAVSMSKYKDNIRICFAGEGPLKGKYEELAKKLGVDADFSFYTRDQLVDLLNKGDLYIHSAFIEIEAISCIEAICCGMVPVINNAKRSATKYFALDDKSLFRENNPRSLSRKIDFWYENPELKAEYVEKYRVMSKQFEQEECMHMMESMLQDAVKLH